MKCEKCGQENPEGLKFCGNCGALLKAQIDPVCPSCGFKNRKRVKFCEKCGSTLTAVGVTGNSDFVETAQEEDSQVPLSSPVIIETQAPKKKQHLNPLWMLLLLLLLVTSCCCLLLLFEQVQVPEVMAPVLDPILHDIRKVLPRIPFLPDNGRGNDDGNDGMVEAPRPITCEEFRDNLKAADLGQETTCFPNRNECYTDITGLENYEDIEVSFQWDTDTKKKATCEKTNDGLRCYFPKNS